jgi:hypothetical protein
MEGVGWTCRPIVRRSLASRNGSPSAFGGGARPPAHLGDDLLDGHPPPVSAFPSCAPCAKSRAPKAPLLCLLL